MKRYALLLIAFLGLWSAHAQAQIVSAETKIAAVEIGGEAAPSGSGSIIYINAKDCADNVKIEFSLQMLGSPAFVEVWRSTSDSNCHEAAGRTATGMADAPCTKIGEAEQSPGASKELTYTALQLFSSNNEECDQKGTPKIYIVPLDNATGDDATSGVSPGLGMANYVTFTVDVDPPSAPTKVKGAPGENEIGVSWSSNDSSNTADGVTVYYDPNSISKAGEACSSDLLVAGKAVADDAALESDGEAAGITKTTRTPGSLGLDIGEQIPVGVVAKDKAGNESVLSDVVCVARVETQGFYERYEDEGGKGLEKCSVQAPGRVSWSGLSSLTLIALGLVWRRRRIA